MGQRDNPPVVSHWQETPAHRWTLTYDRFPEGLWQLRVDLAGETVGYFIDTDWRHLYEVQQFAYRLRPWMTAWRLRRSADALSKTSS